jgi:adenylate cyclase
LVPPIPPLAKSALALAPFPLPKIPVKVSQYWTFKTEAGDAPTLPVVVFQIFALPVYEDFFHLLTKVRPAKSAGCLRDKEALLAAGSLENAVRDIRGIFLGETDLGGRMLRELGRQEAPETDPKKISTLKSLIKMYQNPNSAYLNFYGPPGTIPTISYYEVLRLPGETASRPRSIDLRGKALFVGVSERLLPEQKDGFYTVYSQPSGLDLSGVEMAATAFANLLEDRPVRPLPLGVQLGLLFFWGLVLGIVCYFLPALAAVLILTGMGALYLGVCAHQFNTAGIWYPLVTPLLLQLPFALFGSLTWKTVDANRARQNIRQALRYYLPDKVVDQLAKNFQDLRASRQRVYGICLYTDAADYTTLSEKMDPEDLGNFMKTYYEVLINPIRHYGGTIYTIVGDSILAIWVAENLEADLRAQACLAALDIAAAVDRFNQARDPWQLPTRIGSHSGDLLLDNVGALDHYEYRAIGDIVNTAARIEGLNKYLGTRILISDQVIQQLEGFLTRGLGEFLLAGKNTPLSIHELVCRMQDLTEQQEKLCRLFAEALEAFRKRSWDEAAEKFLESEGIFGRDGPSLFYLELCNRYRENPPEESWTGVVRTEGK